MPTLTIYLANDLYDKVRDAPSKTVRAALEHYFKDDDNKPSQASANTPPAPEDTGKNRNPPKNQ